MTLFAEFLLACVCQRTYDNGHNMLKLMHCWGSSGKMSKHCLLLFSNVKCFVLPAIIKHNPHRKTRKLNPCQLLTVCVAAWRWSVSPSECYAWFSNQRLRSMGHCSIFLLLSQKLTDHLKPTCLSAVLGQAASLIWEPQRSQLGPSTCTIKHVYVLLMNKSLVGFANTPQSYLLPKL